MSDDGKICLSSFKYWAYPVYGWACNLCVVSLDERKILSRRRYLSGEMRARAAYDISHKPPATIEYE